MAYNGLDDFHWYLERQNELVEKYNGKVLVIRNRQVVAAYPTELEAVDETLKTYGFGEFIVQPCSPGPDAYTMFNPRMAALS
jgi:hypothetical protein